jgi:hypothetical protein
MTMTMKLPIILSAMIAALAIPGTLASQADDAAKDAATASDAAAAPEAAAPAEGAPAADAAAPAAEEKKMGKKKMKRKHMEEATDEDGKMKKRKHKKHRRHPDGSGGHVRDKWDAPYDYIDKNDGGGCSGGSDESPKMPVEEVPGQPTPYRGG